MFGDNPCIFKPQQAKKQNNVRPVGTNTSLGIHSVSRSGQSRRCLHEETIGPYTYQPGNSLSFTVSSESSLFT